MIRQIKSGDNLDGEGNPKKWLIKRRLIPIELSVSEGSYVTFQEKLPHGTRKVVGIIITSDRPWEGDEEDDD